MKNSERIPAFIVKNVACGKGYLGHLGAGKGGEARMKKTCPLIGFMLYYLLLHRLFLLIFLQLFYSVSCFSFTSKMFYYTLNLCFDKERENHIRGESGIR